MLTVVVLPVVDDETVVVVSVPVVDDTVVVVSLTVVVLVSTTIFSKAAKDLKSLYPEAHVSIVRT